MDNVLTFIPRNTNNILDFQEKKKNKKSLPKKMTSEEITQLQAEIECLEDMIGNVSVASPEEIEWVCDDGFVMTKDGTVKWNPANKETHEYITSKKKQNRLNHLNQKRKETLKLV